jgi:hypothetical protein
LKGFSPNLDCYQGKEADLGWGVLSPGPRFWKQESLGLCQEVKKNIILFAVFYVSSSSHVITAQISIKVLYYGEVYIYSV